MSASERSGLRLFWERAEKMMKDSRLTLELLEQAQDKFKLNSSVFDSIKNDVQAVMRLIKSWAKGNYRDVPWKSIAMAVAAMIYFVNPFDLIPDFIVGPGLLDDLSILTYVIATLKQDLSSFRTWEVDSKDKKKPSASAIDE